MPPQVTWSVKPGNIAYLTYSQYDGDPLQSVSDLQAFFATLGVADSLVAHEFHGDGGHHYHYLLRWSETFHTRDPRAFDVAGHHPNYKCVRGKDHIRRVVDYCCKDDDYYGDRSPFLDSGTRSNRDAVWAEIVGAESADDFWRLVRELAPFEYVNNYDRLVSYATTHFGKPQAYVPEFVDFDVPGELSDWVRENVSIAPALSRDGPLIFQLRIILYFIIPIASGGYALTP